MRQPSAAVIEKFKADLEKIPHTYSEIARRLGMTPGDLHKKLKHLTLRFLTDFYNVYEGDLKRLDSATTGSGIADFLKTLGNELTAMRSSMQQLSRLSRLTARSRRPKRHGRLDRRLRRR